MYSGPGTYYHTQCQEAERRRLDEKAKALRQVRAEHGLFEGQVVCLCGEDTQIGSIDASAQKAVLHSVKLDDRGKPQFKRTLDFDTVKRFLAAKER